MRISLISDIHGHSTALEAVLDDVAQQPTDAIICLGDVATIGPQPKKVLARLKKLGCSCIMGNHDAALLHPEKALRYKIAPLLIPTLEWCVRQLTPDDTDYLQSFKPVIELALGTDASLVCFHGSPRSAIDSVLATTPAEELDKLFTEQTATILAGGHSHIQMLRQHAGKLIVNPGSVGNAFLLPPMPGAFPTLLPWAEYGIVNWVEGALSIELRRVSFSVAAFSEVVSRSDVPIKSWWLRQYTLPENDWS